MKSCRIKKKKNRQKYHFSKNSYRYTYEDAPYFLAIIGSAFVLLGILNLADLTEAGEGWWYWPAFGCFLATGITFYHRIEAKRAVLKAIKTYKRTNVQELAEDLEMSEKDVKRIIIDSRVSGDLKVAFDPKTGEVVLGSEAEKLEEYRPIKPKKYEEIIEKVPTEALELGEESVSFCPYCSASIPDFAVYCSYCGYKVRSP